MKKIFKFLNCRDGILSAVIAAFIFLTSSSALALPIVSVDVDPLTPGIQSAFQAIIGNPLTVDVVISGVDASEPLNAFEFDLDFDPAILTPLSVVAGGFLLAPVFVVENNIAAPDVNFAGVTLAASGNVGAGILATIQFDIVGFGTTVLDLNDVILSAPFGSSITVGSINDGNVMATPEPATFLLVGAGLAGIAVYSRQRSKIRERT